jgi:transcriptional regulator with XRE-family HTH domain
MTIGNRVKQIRQTIGYTQEKFAKRINISTSYLAEIEVGSKEYNKRILHLISTEFQVDEQWLTTGEGNMYAEGNDAKTALMNSYFRSLSPKYQAYTLEVLQQLADLCYSTNRKKEAVITEQ